MGIENGELLVGLPVQVEPGNLFQLSRADLGLVEDTNDLIAFCDRCG